MVNSIRLNGMYECCFGKEVSNDFCEMVSEVVKDTLFSPENESIREDGEIDEAEIFDEMDQMHEPDVQEADLCEIQMIFNHSETSVISALSNERLVSDHQLWYFKNYIINVVFVNGIFNDLREPEVFSEQVLEKLENLIIDKFIAKRPDLKKTNVLKMMAFWMVYKHYDEKPARLQSLCTFFPSIPRIGFRSMEFFLYELLDFSPIQLRELYEAESSVYNSLQ